MIRYYLLLFARNFRRQKLFSAINLLGLTAGMVSTLLIYLYVQHEFSYDRFHTNADRLYRINQTFIWGDDDNKQFASLGPGIAYNIKTDIPEVEAITRVYPPGSMLVTYQDSKNGVKSFDETNVRAVDTTFFRVFTFPLIKGDPKTALLKPKSMVMSETTALKYFRTTEAVGKLVEVKVGKESETYEVTGVAKDAPENSYIQFDMLISMSSVRGVMEANDRWFWTMFETYVLLDKNASLPAFEAKVQALPKKYADAAVRQMMYQSYDDYIKRGKHWDLFVQPFTSIHLYSTEIYNRLNNVGSIKTIYVLVGVEIFIVLLSCINFMNLSTAQYTRRLKESGLRKILGSAQHQLALHFFAEAFLFCCLAGLLALGIVQLVSPVFNLITGSNVSLDLLNNPKIIFGLLALIIMMSLLSGSYPAIFLSRFSPAEIMKGKMKTGKEGKVVRNGLVTFQFAISMILIACTVVVFQQLKFLANKDIGFDRENLLTVFRGEWVADKEPFIHELENIPGVEIASWGDSAPPNLFNGDQFNTEGANPKTSPLNYVKADENYLPTLHLQLIAGRNFSKEIPSDKDAVILNESAAKAFGWKSDEAVDGKKIVYPGRSSFEVIGVIRDFNYWQLQSPIQPMAIFHQNGKVWSNGSECVVLRISPRDKAAAQTLLADVERQWHIHAGDNPFQYEFVDEAFDRGFASEEKFGQALTVFAGLAILIACFGLLGMIIFTLERRTKEIGIRKVVGASVSSIWLLIVKEYTLLIAISVGLSVPCCVWFLSHWLEDFTYHISISPWAFIISGICMFAASLIITGYHVLRAAMMNPVKVLKDE